MSIHKLLFLLTCSFLFLLITNPFNTFGQDSLIISEFMAVNNDILQDEDGAYSDWIEIHNTGSAQVSLLGWYLTDDIGNALKWGFPDITIASKEYLVVFASEKDRKAEKDKLHANIVFSISEPSQISLKIHNLLGAEITTVVDGFMESGEHTISRNAGNLPAGVCICVLENKTGNTRNRIRLIKE